MFKTKLRKKDWQGKDKGTTLHEHKISSYLVCKIFFKDQFWISFLVWLFSSHWPLSRVPQNFTARVFFPLKWTGPNHTIRALGEILALLNYGMDVHPLGITRAVNSLWAPGPCGRTSRAESCSAGLPCSCLEGAGWGHCASREGGKAPQGPQMLLDNQLGCWQVTSELIAGQNATELSLRTHTPSELENTLRCWSHLCVMWDSLKQWCVSRQAFFVKASIL